MLKRMTIGAVSVVALAMAATFSAQAGDVTDDMILKDATTPTSVLTYGLGTAGSTLQPAQADQHDQRQEARFRPGRSRSAAKSSADRRARRSFTTASSTSPAPTAAFSQSTPRPARRSGNMTPGCRKAFCPAATSSTAAPRSTATRSISRRSTRRSSRSTPRPARSSGRRTIEDFKGGYSDDRGAA